MHDARLFGTELDLTGLDVVGDPHPTLLELAKREGKATGLVTTTAFWDATPAAFAVHTARREDVVAVIDQMLGSGVDLLVGDGAEQFGVGRLPALSDVAARYGWSLVTEPLALASAPSERVLAVFPSQPNDKDVPGARLAELARWALERLAKEPEGFFLVVEHEGTDRASHENAAADLMANLRSFDEAVGVVAGFARERGDTLVLVVGDHETGGLRVVEDTTGRLVLEFGTRMHTGSLVPLFAEGPGAERFVGLYDNTEIFRKVRALTIRTRERSMERDAKGQSWRFWKKE